MGRSKRSRRALQSKRLSGLLTKKDQPSKDQSPQDQPPNEDLDTSASSHAESEKKGEEHPHSLPLSRRPLRSSSLMQTSFPSQELAASEYVPRPLDQPLSDIDENQSRDFHPVQTPSAENPSGPHGQQTQVDIPTIVQPTAPKDQQSQVHTSFSESHKDQDERLLIETHSGGDDQGNEVHTLLTEAPTGQNDSPTQTSAPSTEKRAVPKGLRKKTLYENDRIMIVSRFQNLLHYIESLKIHLHLYIAFDQRLGGKSPSLRYNTEFTSAHGIRI